jgi:subtilisin family serine protease
VDVTAPGGDAGQTPSTVFGRGRILAGWSSTDATGLWDALAGVNRAVVSGGGRYVWISGTSMASPHAAGVAALIREMHPDMPQGAVAALIRSSADRCLARQLGRPLIRAIAQAAPGKLLLRRGIVDAEAAVSSPPELAGNEIFLISRLTLRRDPPRVSILTRTTPGIFHQ